MVKKIWVLKAGALDLDRSILFVGRGFGIKERVPIMMVLLETDEGYVLIDTGMNPYGPKDQEGIWGPRAKDLVPIIEEEDDVRNRLKKLNLSPTDIDHVVNTHMHWDHTGGNQFFTKSRIYVQRAEYRYAMYPDSFYAASYMKNHYDYDLNYVLVEGDMEIVSGVHLLATPGHTIGHQSVFVTMENGAKIIIAGDAAYTWESVEKIVPPGNCYDMVGSVLSLQKLQTIQRITGADLLPSHEPNHEFYHTIQNSFNKSLNLQII
ncbi:MAG: hypothetical protein CVU87_04015 [Firmicutes bacterium HGW-Firmicutes-12]|jgi:N-acyl homoserine lactone hydrolase|nr:MAG: hypothetical protein CVU87_04015 [Firmicutes bacterium HGW-Firmicutes-12]